jgi:prepilin-type N-terminal cleavage/methylation domain-containing protein
MKRGLTLIELMVAVALTGILVWLTLDLFTGENKAYTRTRERVRLQADSREALRLIEAEIRNMGYKSTVAISTNRIRASMGTCSDTWINAGAGDSSSFGYKNATSLAGDSIAFLFHEANEGPLSSCTNLRTIGYRKFGSLLQRRWCDGACTNEPWIALLDSVVSFQIRYGMIAHPKDTSAANGPIQTATPSRWTLGNLTKSGTAPNMSLTGWNTSRQRAIHGFAIDSLDPAHTWEISFACTPNAALLADMDTSSFRVGFFNADGSVSGPRDTLNFYPGSSSSAERTVRVVLAPSSGATSGRYLGIEGRLKSTTQAGWSLSVSNFKARRLSRGRHIWVEAPTVAQKNMVKAVDIRLLVKARRTTDEASPGPFDATALGQSGLVYTPAGADEKRSYVLFQRVFPVVNNGI